MRINNYNQFILKESKEDIDSICEEYGIRNYTINEDGSIDVDGRVDLSGKYLNKIPLKFNRVSGHFTCSNNWLKSLEGCPKFVGSEFYCSYNYLTSLKGCPEFIGDDFFCEDNQLTSLEGFPEFYDGIIHIYENPVYDIVKLFPGERFCKAIYWLNEFEVIRDGDKVVLDRLEEVFIQMDLKVPENMKFDYYEII